MAADPNLSSFLWSVGDLLRAYIHGFSAPVRDIFECFEFHTQIDRLGKAGLHFYVLKSPRPRAEIDVELGQVRDRIVSMSGG